MHENYVTPWFVFFKVTYRYIFLTTFSFWKFKKFNFFYILRWTMTNLNFDLTFLQEAKGTWCFVYNHRSSTGNTNPWQRRIYSSQVSLQSHWLSSSLQHLIVGLSRVLFYFQLMFCLYRVCRPKPKSKGGESNAKEISDVWWYSPCFATF